jgi:hypothetical protein
MVALRTELRLPSCCINTAMRQGTLASGTSDLKINASDFDGENTSAAWLGKGDHVRTKPLMWKTSSVNSDAGIRDGQWKLIYPTRKNRAELALYDIENDPGESENIASRHPDIVKKLSSKVQSWVETLPKDYIKTDDNNK